MVISSWIMKRLYYYYNYARALSIEPTLMMQRELKHPLSASDGSPVIL